MIDAKIDAVQAAPDQIIPSGAVPEPAQQHCDHEIDIPAFFPEPVATQRNIEIVAQESRQGDVPELPELDDGERLVG